MATPTNNHAQKLQEAAQALIQAACKEVDAQSDISSNPDAQQQQDAAQPWMKWTVRKK
jgi:hypothetical protein